MPECINLLTTFGTRYQIGYDPAYDPRGKARKEPDPWMLTIPCRYGTIYPSGGDKLRVDIDGHNHIAAAVAKVPGCRLVQNGDCEKTIEFTLATFPTIAKIVKPRLNRELTPKERQRRERLSELGRDSRFPKTSDLTDAVNFHSTRH